MQVRIDLHELSEAEWAHGVTDFALKDKDGRLWDFPYRFTARIDMEKKQAIMGHVDPDDCEYLVAYPSVAEMLDDGTFDLIPNPFHIAAQTDWAAIEEGEPHKMLFDNRLFYSTSIAAKAMGVTPRTMRNYVRQYPWLKIRKGRDYESLKRYNLSGYMLNCLYYGIPPMETHLPSSPPPNVPAMTMRPRKGKKSNLTKDSKATRPNPRPQR